MADALLLELLEVIDDGWLSHVEAHHTEMIPASVE